LAKMLLQVIRTNEGFVLANSYVACSMPDLPLHLTTVEGDIWFVEERDGIIELLTKVNSETIYVHEANALYLYRFDTAEPEKIERPPKSIDTRNKQDMEQDDTLSVVFQSIEVLRETFALGETEHILETGAVITAICRANGYRIVRKCPETGVVQIVSPDANTLKKILETRKHIRLRYVDGCLYLGDNDFVFIDEYTLVELFPDLIVSVVVRPNQQEVYGTIRCSRLENEQTIHYGTIQGDYTLIGNRVFPPRIFHTAHPEFVRKANVKYVPIGYAKIQQLIVKRICEYVENHPEPKLEVVRKIIFDIYVDVDGTILYPFDKDTGIKLLERIKTIYGLEPENKIPLIDIFEYVRKKIEESNEKEHEGIERNRIIDR